MHVNFFIGDRSKLMSQMSHLPEWRRKRGVWKSKFKWETFMHASGVLFSYFGGRSSEKERS